MSTPKTVHFPNREPETREYALPPSTTRSEKPNRLKRKPQASKDHPPSTTVRLAPDHNALECLRNVRHQARVIQNGVFGKNYNSWGNISGALEDSEDRHGQLLVVRTAARLLIDNLEVLIQAEES